ncbi:MAG: hypothetical protein M1269_02100 [Chloroflexi bacterium]|nr:hypothetical protein [Chloroflexota bacterium]
MKTNFRKLIITGLLTGWFIFGPAFASKIINGTVIGNNDGKTVTVNVQPGLNTVFGLENITLTDSEGAPLSPYAVLPGDTLSVTVNDDGSVGRIRDDIRSSSGIIVSNHNYKIIFEDGSAFVIPEGASVRINGLEADLSRVRPGMRAFVRTPPDDNSALALDVYTTAESLPQAPGVRIKEINTDYLQPLKSGDEIKIRVTGTPGCSVLLDLPGGFHKMPAKEILPGIYEASFRIPAGLNLRQTCFIAFLCKGGVCSGAVSRPLDIAADPPKIFNMVPAPGSDVRTRLPVISAAISCPGTLVMQEGISVQLDERPITSGSIRTPAGVVFRPVEPLAPGRHTVKIQVSDLAGNKAVYTWDFNIR